MITEKELNEMVEKIVMSLIPNNLTPERFKRNVQQFMNKMKMDVEKKGLPFCKGE